jgi:hypothetical protein
MTEGENMVEPIPVEVLEAARLRFKRRMAAMLLRALAEAGCSTDQVEARIGMRRGGFMAYVNRLVQGKERGLDPMVDIAFACGFEISVEVQPLRTALSQPNEEGEGK